MNNTVNVHNDIPRINHTKKPVKCSSSIFGNAGEIRDGIISGTHANTILHILQQQHLYSNLYKYEINYIVGGCYNSVQQALLVELCLH